MSQMKNLPDSQRSLNQMISSKSSSLHLGNGQAGGGASHQAVTVKFVLNALRQWWKVALPIGLVLGGISGTLAYLFFEPMYEASSWLQIEGMAPYIAFQTQDDSRRFIATQEQLIRSPLVLGPVVSQPEIARLRDIEEQDDPITWLGEEIEVKSVGESELFTVSLRSPEPANSARIVNAVTDAFFKLRGQQDAQRVQRVIQLLEQERERRASELARLRENVRELTKQATGRDPFAAAPSPEGDPLQQHPLAGLQGRLITAEVEQEILKAQIKAFEELVSQREVEVPEGLVETAVEQSEEIQTRNALLLEKRAKLAEIKEKSAKGEEDPSYKRLKTEIDQDEGTLEQVRKDMATQIKVEMETNLVNRRKAGLEQMQSELENYSFMQKALQERYDSQLADLKQFSGETLELEFKRAELARAEEVHNLITARAVQLRTEQRAPARINMLQSATVPTTPVSTPYKMVSMASLAGLCFPFVLVVLWERVVRRVTDTEHLEQHANLTVVGEIARLPARGAVSRRFSSGRVGQDLRMFEESIDGLRTCLMLSEPLKDVKILAVTSANRQEGKTSVAAQLAVSVARASGEPTLVIDGDMRSPDIHTVFEIPLEPGLADVLAGECTLKDAIVTTWSKHVHLLPTGKLRTSPHKLLGNGALESLLGEVRSSYRSIIIDTPPVLAASEALVLAKAADACLLCAMQDASRIDHVRRAWERFVAAGARPVGVVLSGIPRKRYAYRYGSYAYPPE